MYKILKLDKILSICGAVYRVDYDVILTYDEMSDEDILEWFKESDYKDDNYLICEYDNNDKYIKTVGVVFYHKDETEYESFVDVAEHDYRVYGDAAHHPVKDKYLYSGLIDAIKELDLLDDVVNLVNEEFYKRYL